MNYLLYGSILWIIIGFLTCLFIRIKDKSKMPIYDWIRFSLLGPFLLFAYLIIITGGFLEKYKITEKIIDFFSKEL